MTTTYRDTLWHDKAVLTASYVGGPRQGIQDVADVTIFPNVVSLGTATYVEMQIEVGGSTMAAEAEIAVPGSGLVTDPQPVTYRFTTTGAKPPIHLPVNSKFLRVTARANAAGTGASFLVEYERAVS